MAVVYIVTVGDYSAYQIVAAFSEVRNADAEQCAELIGGEVEKYVLDQTQYEDPGMDFYNVDITHAGKVDCCFALPRLDGDGSKQQASIALRTHRDYPSERKSYWRLYWAGYAQSEEHARRSASQVHREILAGQRPAGVDFGKN